MEKKRSVGVTIFGILLILWSLVQIVPGLDFSKYSFLFQPLPKQIITMRYFITIIMLVLALISGVGVLFLKDFFRKTALIIASYSIFTYLIEGPFFCFRNFPKFVEQSLAETIAKAPNISSPTLSLALWGSIIFFWAIDFSFAICLIYFFTRSKIKEQFK